MYIYLTTNLINNKKYIGRHCHKKLNNNYIGSGYVFKKAVLKYGKENFKKQIIDSNINSFEELCEREIYYIKKYKAVKSKKFYNLMPGGLDRVNNLDKKLLEKIYSNRRGSKSSEETIKKLKESHKNQRNLNLTKPILQYDNKMNLICEHASISDATRKLNKCIGSSSQLSIACKIGILTWGFYWKYKLETSNRKLFGKRDTSMYKGVAYNRVVGRYNAKINYMYKSYSLGMFSTPEEASEAYELKKKEFDMIRNELKLEPTTKSK